MAETQARVLTGAAQGVAGRRPRSWFYVVLAILMTLLIAAGFWPSYYGPLVRGTVQAPWILHMHGVVYAGWMVLLIAQATLAARGQIRTHRALGTFGIGYGVLVWLVGIYVSFAAPALRVTRGDWPVDQAAAFLPIPVGDMVLFGSFFFAAVLYRGQPEIHKRLMLLATIALLFAAAFRLNAAGLPFAIAVGLWFLPVVLGMIHDIRTRGRPHVLWYVGAVVMAIALLRLPFGETETWLRMGRPIVEAIT